jgi:hypothetical protein
MEFIMRNVGSLDRIIRALTGIALIAAALLSGLGGGLAVAPLIAVGVILTATAAFGFCPIYALLSLASKRNSAR